MEGQFDIFMAQQCAQAYAGVTGLGCSLSDKQGRSLCEFGFSCERCQLCNLVGFGQNTRVETQMYGMTAAQRFGGKYIYRCPTGLVCFASPILGDNGVEATLIAGPFLMVDRQDFLEYELKETLGISEPELKQAEALLQQLPYVEPARVTQLSTLLFMAVQSLNSTYAQNQLHQADRVAEIQGQISTYIMQAKEKGRPTYPFDLEADFLSSVETKDYQRTQVLLNQLLGCIILMAGGDLEEIKSRVYELFVLLSRTVIEQGVDSAWVLRRIHFFRQEMAKQNTQATLCVYFSDAVRSFMEEMIGFADSPHSRLIQQCIRYINSNYAEKVTLSAMAKRVYLSTSYLSRIFKQETGSSFSDYLNQVRIHRAKVYLRQWDIRLTDVAHLVGFEDQSHFTRTFKRLTGVLPKEYRMQNGSQRDVAREESDNPV